jgi:hypothetical protein
MDGSLFFPDIGILIKSNLQHFDSLSIAKQVGHRKDQVEDGLPHMNINPKNAYDLEQKGLYPTGKAEQIELLHDDFLVSFPSAKNPKVMIKCLVEVIVVDSVKAAKLCGTKKPKGSNWINGSEMVKAVQYLCEHHVTTAKARRIDVIAIFATPFNPKGSCHALTMRWLCAQCPPRTAFESSQLYSYLTGLLSKGRGSMEIARVGGSNGVAQVSKEFFTMLHLPGITPRKSYAVMWYPVETKWLFFYISPYKTTRTLACRAYSQPMPGGQFQITKKKLLHASCPVNLDSVLERFVTVKAESAPLVSSLSRTVLEPRIGFTACRDANTVQHATNAVARRCADRSGNKDEFFLHLLTSCSFTVVAYATCLHIDTPRKHPFLPFQGFWENKWVIDVPLQGTNDPGQPALGRGGAGRGKFAMALLDHSYRLCDAYGWGDRNESGNGVLFRELVRVAREMNIQGPDAPDIESVIESVEV